MNARDNTPLRVLIAAHLDAAGECAALAIAKAIGKGDVPSVVVKELNAMRTDGQVECEQRKKEMLYWLAVPLAQIAGSAHEAPAAPASDLPPGVREGTRAAQIYRALPAFGAAPVTAREIATSTGCAKGLIAPVLTAMDKAGQLTRIPAGVEGGGLYGYTRLPPAGGDSEGGETDITAAKDIPPPQYDPNEVAFTAPADPAELPATIDARLADAEQRALVAAEMLTERDRTIETLQDMIRVASETLAPLVLGDTDTSDMDLQEIAEKVAAVVNAHDDELLAQAKTIIDLRGQLEELHRKSLRDASSLLSNVDRPTPAGYLVRATKRKPRTLQAEDKAREAALGAIRAGAPRAEVFALVPLGHARRGAEWRSA
jgi:hypothetical protein